MENRKTRIIVAITGASGAIYGKRTLEALKEVTDIETHLIISKAANITIDLELEESIKDIEKLADETHKVNDIAACISSGSYKTEGMIIAPCSMKTLAEIATGVSSNLISRSADVILKEKKKLVLLARETPLNAIHIENMLRVTNAGGYICPPVPAFYNHPEKIDDIVDHTVGRILDIFNVESSLARRWKDDKKLHVIGEK